MRNNLFYRCTKKYINTTWADSGRGDQRERERERERERGGVKTISQT